MTLKNLDSITQPYVPGEEALVQFAKRTIETSVSADSATTDQPKHAYPLTSKRHIKDSDRFATLLLKMYKKWLGSNDYKFYHIFCHIYLHQDLPWKSLFEMCVKEGLVEKAFRLYVHVIEEGIVDAEEECFLAIAKSCLAKSNNKLSKRIYAYMTEIPMPIHAHLGNVLLNLHIKSESFNDDIWNLFTAILDRDVITWTIMISGQCRNGQADQALMLFEQMKEEGMNPDAMACVGVLSACVRGGYLEKGRHIHVYILFMGLSNNVYIANTLIDLYATWGSIKEAHRVFDEMVYRDAISWNILIAGNAKAGNHEEAMRLFWHMCWDGHNWTNVTFLKILDVLASLGDLNLCRELHVIMLAFELESSTFVNNALVHTYSKCGSILEARRIFRMIKKPDVAACTAMITGFTKHGHGGDAWNCFVEMVKRGIKPNEITYVNVLNSCASLEQVKKVHEHILDVRITLNIFMGNALLTMYAKFGKFDFALQVFDQMPLRNVISWTSVLSSYAKNGHTDVAFKVFEAMELEGIQPNEVTFMCMLSVCTTLECLDFGQYFHDYIVQSDFQHNDAINNALMDMYLKCGSLVEAYDVFSKQGGMPMWASVTVDNNLEDDDSKLYTMGIG